MISAAGGVNDMTLVVKSITCEVNDLFPVLGSLTVANSIKNVTVIVENQISLFHCHLTSSDDYAYRVSQLFHSIKYSFAQLVGRYNS